MSTGSRVQVAVKMPADVARQLRDGARRLGTSVSALCRDGGLAELKKRAAEMAATSEQLDDR